MKTRVRILIIVVISSLLLSALAFAVTGQRSKEPDAEGQWEYLVVAGGNANLSTAGNDSSLRKQPDTSFAREFYPLERNFDKLGAKGWELVAVHPSQNEPVYFFKRRKETR